MRPTILKIALLASVLLNAGVIAGVGYRVVQERAAAASTTSATTFDLPRHLGLDEQQRRRWTELEGDFMEEIESAWHDMTSHREKLIREIFAERPDPARIEAERAAIAEAQARQQRRVVAQLLKEREVLNAEQRRALAELLVNETPAPLLERRLHRQ